MQPRPQPNSTTARFWPLTLLRALIARMSGGPEDRVKTALSVAVAAVAEVVSALGLFAVWAPSKEMTKPGATCGAFFGENSRKGSGLAQY